MLCVPAQFVNAQSGSSSSSLKTKEAEWLPSLIDFAPLASCPCIQVALCVHLVVRSTGWHSSKDKGLVPVVIRGKLDLARRNVRGARGASTIAPRSAPGELRLLLRCGRGEDGSWGGLRSDDFCSDCSDCSGFLFSHASALPLSSVAAATFSPLIASAGAAVAALFFYNPPLRSFFFLAFFFSCFFCSVWLTLWFFKVTHCFLETLFSRFYEQEEKISRTKR